MLYNIIVPREAELLKMKEIKNDEKEYYANSGESGAR